MNVNPNLRNPLALFALCFLLIESVMTSVLITQVNDIELCPWVVEMLFIFIVAFPSVLFIGFYVLLWCKADVLFSPYENAMAERIKKMGEKEIVDNQKAKDARYGISLQSSSATNLREGPQRPVVIPSEEEILDQYIALFAPFLQKNIRVETKNGVRYFDAYANWNGCNFVLEVKILHKWTSMSVQGVRQFASNARSSFSPLHMTLLLKMEDKYSIDEIVETIHKVDAAINIVFVSGESNNIKFSERF